VIEKVVPTVRPAITEVTKVISFKPEDIKTIQTSLDDNQYTVVVVDQSSQVK
jgi:predicted LPLAT superfamily acyltransferase